MAVITDAASVMTATMHILLSQRRPRRRAVPPTYRASGMAQKIGGVFSIAGKARRTGDCRLLTRLQRTLAWRARLTAPRDKGPGSNISIWYLAQQPKALEHPGWAGCLPSRRQGFALTT